MKGSGRTAMFVVLNLVICHSGHVTRRDMNIRLPMLPALLVPFPDSKAEAKEERWKSTV